MATMVKPLTHEHVTMMSPTDMVCRLKDISVAELLDDIPTTMGNGRDLIAWDLHLTPDGRPTEVRYYQPEGNINLTVYID